MSSEINEKHSRFFNLQSPLHKACLPPPNAYLYFPKGIELIEFNPSEPLKTLRRIFEGGVEYNDFEKEKLREFYDYLQKENEKYRIKGKTDNMIILPDTWKEFNTLRFLQARSYDFEKTAQITKDHIKWRKENIPLKMSDKAIEILNDLGFVYYHGRDNKFRPTMVVVAKVYMQNQHNYSYEYWVTAFIYLLEYAINNLLLPGQVENWNIICDLADVSVLTLPSDFKKIFETLQCNYRCRLYVMYLLNMSSFIVFLWNIIKGMLDPTTERKLKILGAKDQSEILRFLNPEQVEKRFGGTAENVTKNFFPPRMPSTNYLKPGDNPNELFVDNKTYLEILEKNNKLLKSPYVKKEKPKKPKVVKTEEKKPVQETKLIKAMTIESEDDHGVETAKKVDHAKNLEIESNKFKEEKEENDNKEIYANFELKTKKSNKVFIKNVVALPAKYQGINHNAHNYPNSPPNWNDFGNSVDTEFSFSSSTLKKKHLIEIGKRKHIGPGLGNHFKDLAKLSSNGRSEIEHNEEADDISSLNHLQRMSSSKKNTVTNLSEHGNQVHEFQIRQGPNHEYEDEMPTYAKSGYPGAMEDPNLSHQAQSSHKNKEQVFQQYHQETATPTPNSKTTTFDTKEETAFSCNCNIF